MMLRLPFSFVLMALVFGAIGPITAQPMHPEHRYMVTEHTAVNRLTGLLTQSFREVEIRRLDVPATVVAGEEAVYSVIANVESATLPINAVWDFGDGVKKKGLSVEHVFGSAGDREVTVTVSNVRSSESRTFTVLVRERGDV